MLHALNKKPKIVHAVSRKRPRENYLGLFKTWK